MSESFTESAGGDPALPRSLFCSWDKPEALITDVSTEYSLESDGVKSEPEELEETNKESDDERIQVVNLPNLLRSSEDDEPSSSSPAQTHHSVRHLCEVCSQIFPSYERLNLHKMGHCYINIVPLPTLPKLISKTTETHAGTRCFDEVKFETPESGSDTDNEDSIEERVNSVNQISNLEGCERRMDRVRKVKPFKCTECERIYKSKKSLQRHIQDFHPNSTLAKTDRKVHTCSACGRMFTRIWNLVLHERQDHPQEFQRRMATSEVHRCPECDKAFFNLKSKQNHVRIAHKKVNISHGMEETVDSLSQISNLESCESSKDSVRKVKPFNCTECEKIFSTKKTLHRHIQVFHPNTYKMVKPNRKIHTCNECGRVFTRIWNLILHEQRDHPQEFERRMAASAEVYRCPECDKTFFNLKSQENHVRNVHEKYKIKSHDSSPSPQTKESLFICDVCGFYTKKKDTLECHMNIHSEERKYKCRYCSYAAKQRQGLVTHISSQHGGPPRHQCPKCGELFKLYSCLKLHINNVHDNIRRFPCGVCGIAFKAKTHLKYHVGTHSNPNSRKRGLNKLREPRRRRENTAKVRQLGNYIQPHLPVENPGVQ